MTRIVYTENNMVCIVIPVDDKPIEQIASETVPHGVAYRIVTEDKLPTSKNWRAAWTDEHPTDTVDVDLAKAKMCHKNLMYRFAKERVAADAFGTQDFSTVQAEIDAIDFDAVMDLETLYNIFPASIDQRQNPRVYNMHDHLDT